MSKITNGELQCYSLFQMVSRRGGCVSVSRVDGREPGWRWRDQRERSSTLFRKKIGPISKSSSPLVQMAKYVPCGILIVVSSLLLLLLLLLPLRVVVLVVLWGVLLVMAYKVFTMEREYTEYDPYSILELDSVRHLSDRNALAAFSLSLSLFLPTLAHSPLFFLFLFSSFPPPSFPCLHPPLYRALQWEKLESSIGN